MQLSSRATGSSGQPQRRRSTPPADAAVDCPGHALADPRCKRRTDRSVANKARSMSPTSDRVTVSVMWSVGHSVAEPNCNREASMVTVTTSDMPRYRSILAVDIENSAARTNSTKAKLRHVLYELFEKSLQVTGIAKCHRDALIDRGDGILPLIHPVDQASKVLLLNPFISTLSRLLTDHDTHYPNHQFRLRVVVHAGEVHYDDRGCFGEALDITFRLLDATEVKRRLRQAAAPLVLVVSNDIYRSVIRHRYPGIEENAFEPLAPVRLAGQQHRGWIYVPAIGDLDHAFSSCWSQSCDL
jgi:hypothetical protein